MARALLGYVGNSNSNEQALALEVARLRRRIAELETEIAELRDHDQAVLDIELHRISEVAAPALA
jgi:phage shock protein A